jgi:integrase
MRQPLISLLVTLIPVLSRAITWERKVKMPKLYREDEDLDASDIRKILLSCNNRRLKAYLLVLASGGMRAIEGLAIRLKDVDLQLTQLKFISERNIQRQKLQGIFTSQMKQRNT